MLQLKTPVCLFPSFFCASYSSQNGSFHSIGTMHTDTKIVSRQPEKILCWWKSCTSPKESLRIECLASLHFCLPFPDSRLYKPYWAVRRPWWSLAAQTHICPHIAQPMSPTAAAAVSQIREPKWKDGSDLGLEGPCNLLQPSGHCGRVTWKIKCREVS